MVAQVLGIERSANIAIRIKQPIHTEGTSTGWVPAGRFRGWARGDQVDVCFLLFDNQFGCTFRTGIDLTTGAGKAIAAGPVGKITLYGGTTVMTEYEPDQLIHSDEGWLL